MTQREAVTIVLQQCERSLRDEKGMIDKSKLDPKLVQAIDIVSPLISHGWFSDER